MFRHETKSKILRAFMDTSELILVRSVVARNEMRHKAKLSNAIEKRRVRHETFLQKKLSSDTHCSMRQSRKKNAPIAPIAADTGTIADAVAVVVSLRFPRRSLAVDATLPLTVGASARMPMPAGGDSTNTTRTKTSCTLFRLI
jgi:hypothetical protein